MKGVKFMFQKKFGMIRVSLLIMILVVITSTGLAAKLNEDEQANQILLTFNKLILDNQDKNREISIRCVLFQERMIRQELSIVIDYSLTEDIYEGMGFTMGHPQTGLPAIVISSYFLKIYDKHPSIFYSALMHEIAHVYDFFTNNESFSNSEENMLEKYLYEMDAAYIEALFIRDILITNKIPLTRYEKFLVNSLEKDNLAAFSVGFKAVDMNMVYNLVGLSRGDLLKKEKIKRVAVCGEEILNRFTRPEKELDWEEYCSLVELWSFCQYVPQILVDIESIAKPGFNHEDCKLENYPDVKKCLDRIIEIGDSYFKDMHQYRNNLLKAYSDL